MNCPRCQSPLVMSERQAIEIDYCPSCRGVWLDRGELDKVIARSAEYEGRSDRDDDHDNDDDRHRQGRPFQPPPVPGYGSPSRPGGYAGPAGGYPPNPGYPPNAGHPPQGYYDPRQDPRNRKYKKRKSFWSELFD